MIYVALAVLVIAAIMVAVALSALRWMQRALDRKDKALLELVDRAMLLAGKPWNNPPAQTEHLEAADKAAARRTAELEAAWDGIVEDPQPGAHYSSREYVADIEEMLAAHDREALREPLLIDTADVDPV